MSVVLESMRDKPQVYCPMSDTAPFDDHSGYGRHGVLTGTAGRHVGLGAGMSQAAILGPATVAFDSPVFRQGFERQVFTLEALVRSISTTEGLVAQPYRENLVANPSFENNTTGWNQAGSGSSLGRGGTRTVMGNAAAYSTAAGTATTALIETSTSALIPLTPGKTYTLSAFGSSDATVNLSVYMHKFKNNAYVGTFGTSSQTAAASWFKRVTFTFTVPSDDTVTQGMIGLQASAGANIPNGSVIWWDCVMLEEGSAATQYFDGSTPGYEWTGAAGNSTSRARKDVSRSNWLPNPSGVSTTAHANQHGSVTNSTSIKLFGDSSVGATRTQAGAGDNRLNHALLWPVHPPGGTTYTSVWVYTPVALNCMLEVFYTDMSGTPQYPSSGNIAVSANTWTKLTLNLPSTGVKVITGAQIVAVGTFPNGSTMYADGWYMSETPGDFFNPDADGSAWWSTANNSSSFLLASEAEQQVLGTLNNLDGLTVEGTKVHFVTKYLTTGEARCTYDLQQQRTVMAHGVHTKDRNQLFVDGQLVAEVSINEAQQADQFKATDGKLYSGATTSGSRIAVNAIGIYGTALHKEAINRHVIISKQVPESEDIAAANEGNVIPTSLSNSKVFLDQWWSTAEDWNNAQLVNTYVYNDRLVPTFSGDVSLAGTWIDTFGFEAAQTTSMYGVVLNWDGEGAVVQVSLDGASWETVQRGVKVSTVPDGFDPTDKVLMVKVSFPGGITNDTSYVDNLNVVGLRSNVTPPAAGRTLTLSGASQERDYPALQMHDNWGVQINSGGSVIVSADTSTDPVPVRTLELWIKRTGDTNPTVSMAGTTYVDGAAGSTLNRDQWHLMHIVAPADVTGTITITGPAQVGQITLYETAFDATKVSDMVAEYTASDITVVRDASVISLQESAQAVTIYAHDWSISSSG